jgi:hypothetical protein
MPLFSVKFEIIITMFAFEDSSFLARVPTVVASVRLSFKYLNLFRYFTNILLEISASILNAFE